MDNKELITSTRCWFGADPELFLTDSSGKVIGSERVIPEEGIDHDEAKFPGVYNEKTRLEGGLYYKPKGRIAIVRDGVQIELQLPATSCRGLLGHVISTAFRQLKVRLDELDAAGQKFQVCYREVVDVERSELNALSPDSRRLGCQPSFNIYDDVAGIGVDPDTYTKRSAGGHIHFGLPEDLMPERNRLPALLDVLLGNTSVLIDRDPDAAERRRVYGRAGEFRLPRHGIEYRTLSNFWLRSKELVSLVTGLGRLAVFVLDTSIQKGGWPADKELMKQVNLKDIQRAINTNDLELARKNYAGVREFITRHTKKRIDAGLDVTLVDQFDHFIKRIDEKGLDYWFPDDPMTHWHKWGYAPGWEQFLAEVVQKDAGYSGAVWTYNYMHDRYEATPPAAPVQASEIR